jgi:ribonuclease-3
MPDLAAEQDLAKRMGVSFTNLRLLRLALTHRSVLQDWMLLPEVDAAVQSNERLEFLGDALLGAFVAEYLYLQDVNADEGALTRRRVAIVRAETLVREALVGAVCLDQGHDAAERFVLRFLERDGPSLRQSEADANPKGRLQEILQERAIPAPEYVTSASTGPDHAREFTEIVLIDGEQRGAGAGRSRRLAQQEAARQAILSLESEVDESPN